MKFRSIGVDPPRGLQPRRRPALSAQIAALPFRSLPLPLVNIATLLAFVLLATSGRAQSAADGFDTGTGRTPRVSAAHAAGKIGIKENSTAPSRGRHMPLIITSDYQYDDGSSEEALGYGNGGQNFEAIWFNEFSVIPGKTNITCVQIAWGSPIVPQQINGTPTTIGIWGDPNGDGNPSDAVLLGSVAGTMSMSNTDTFINYAFSPPIDVSAFTHFFVGDLTPMNNGPAELFFQAQDTDASQGRSWVAAMSSGAPVDFNNLGNNDLLGTIDSFGTPGNWMIRVNAGGACPTAPGFQNTGSLATARESHTARLLPDGTVLVAGGHDSSTDSVFASAELYQPASGTWTATGSMTNARELHTAILLPGGTVLVAGGFNLTTALASAELYSVGSHTWSDTGSLLNPRFFHRAIFLPNGLVLVAGGENTDLVASAELYDPAGHSWMPTGNLINPRYLHTATFLNDGTVLVAGGLDINVVALATAELYDPASQVWMPTGSLINPRHSHTATLLPDGTVLVAGGRNTNGIALANAELYDSASHSWMPTGSLINPRYFHTSTLLPNGMVLVAGGLSAPGSALANAELYDPSSHSWMPTGSLAIARALHTATLLMNGNVLIAGGQDSTGKALASSELYILPPGSNADLMDLSLSAGMISPAFDPDITSYTLSVPNSTTSTTVTPTAQDGAATITVNGQTVPSGGTSNPIGLNVGNTTISTVVTAQDGTTTKTYTVTVTRAPNSNANLSNLVLSAGAISPAFNPNITSYTLSVPNSTTSTTVTPTAQDTTATIKVNGQTVSSGGTSNPIGLNVGDNTIDTIVTAQDGTTTKTYTVTVTRAASSNANLSNLILSAGAISPAFNSNITSYTLSVPNSTASTTVTPTAQDTTATIKVNGQTVSSGGTSNPIALNVGDNTIDTIVTAQDGTTAKTYTVTVTRAASSNANLSNLILSAGAISPAFNSNITSYTLSVPNSTTSTTVTPTAQDSAATIKVNGQTVPSGGTSNSIALNVGSNAISTVATAQDGSTTKTYTVTVTRMTASPPVFFSPTSAITTVDRDFSYQPEATGAPTFSVDETTLPPGLIFDPALVALVGRPTTDGLFHIKLMASNLDGTTPATLDLTVQKAPLSGPIIISTTSATGRTGNYFEFQVLTRGGTPEARLTADNLPTDLNFDSLSGQISGTQGSDGSFLVTLTVTDGDQLNKATLQLTFTSDAAVPVIVSSDTAMLVPGQFFTYQILADGGANLSYAVVGDLPDGLSFDKDSGVISGFPQLASSSRPVPDVSGGVITNVAIYAIDSSSGAVTLKGTNQLVAFLLSTGARNISTRAYVDTGDRALIAGFIIRVAPGSTPAPMKLVLRAIGPSLSTATPPVPNPLANPFLSLHYGDPEIAANDDWKDNLEDPMMKKGTQKMAIEATTIPPTNPLESAVLAVLNPGVYTAIVSGTAPSSSNGVGLVEVYNIATQGTAGGTDLANISTRGYVQTGGNVMIGGFIHKGSTSVTVVLRAIGPSLASSGINDPLPDPALDLNDANGNIIATNDDWKTNSAADQAIITQNGLDKSGGSPINDLESVLVATLPPNTGDGTPYTATVRGSPKNTNPNGIGLVEAYFLP